MLEDLLLPWWKPPIILVAIGFLAVCLRIAVTFDVNAWLQKRQDDKQKKERMELVQDCSHLWTLYRDSTHSRCDSCGGLISTTLLLSAREFAPRGNVPSPVISGEARFMMIKVGKGEIVTDNYVGKIDA